MRAANGRRFGARRRQEYTNWFDEQRSWKDTCYVGDWSFLANCRLRGPEALSLLSALSVNSFRDYDVGQGKHLVQCDEDGHVVAEGVLLRESDEAFVLHGVPGYWTAYNLESGAYDATMEWRDTFNFQVQGPNALYVLEALVDESIRDVEFIHFATVTIAGREVTAVRMGMAGEVGFELQGPAEDGKAVWNAILEAGQDWGILELSAKTSSINHLEASFPTRGRDYVPAIFGEAMADYRTWLEAASTRDLLTYPIEGSFDADDVSAWYRTPVELGWGGNVAFDHEFVGRAALSTEVRDPSRTIVTLVWDADDVVSGYASLFADGPAAKFMEMPHQQKRGMVADEVRRNGEPVGVSTCRGYSYYFREMLSLCVIGVEHNEPGTEVTVVWGEGEAPASPTVESHEPVAIRAHVAPAPYKPDNRRVDLHSL